MKIKCIISYDGTNYYGFQRQSNRNTIQEFVEKAIFKITGEKITIYVSGRTDRFVHALGQVFHFETAYSMPESKWQQALNAHLPNDIRIVDSVYADEAFHARYSIQKKEYRYYIEMNDYDLFKRNYVEFIKKLNVDKMLEAIKYFLGTHDFTSFSSNGQIENTIRTIYEAKLNYQNNQIEIIFIGSGFMRYMVRRMVGALVLIGEEKEEISYIQTLLEEKNRKACSRKVSGKGLFLWKVYY